jgi:hypothetical protein
MRHNLLYTSHSLFLAPGVGDWNQSLDQTRQFQKIDYSERGASGCDSDKRIFVENTGPPGRNRAQPPGFVMVVNPILPPVVLVRYKGVCFPVEGMKGMGDLESLCLTLAQAGI